MTDESQILLEVPQRTSYSVIVVKNNQWERIMGVAKRVMVGNSEAILFKNGDISWAGQIFEMGRGVNDTVLRALGLKK